MNIYVYRYIHTHKHKHTHTHTPSHQLFSAADSNNDNVLSIDEFAKGMVPILMEAQVRVHMFACLHACMHVRVNVCLWLSIDEFVLSLLLLKLKFVYAYGFVCVCVCMCVRACLCACERESTRARAREE